MNKNTKTFILFCFICCFVSLKAQVKDAGLWLSLNAEKKLTSKFALQLTEDFRFNENITELGTVFTELGAEYKITKGLTTTASYRFAQKRRVDDFYSIRHRYNIDIAYKIKMKKLSLTMRGRIQSQYKDINSSETGPVPSNYLRSKFTFKYITEKKYNPLFAIEFFNQLNNPAGNEVDNIRYQIGLDYELNKFSSITLSYLINKEINVNDPWTNYIIGIGYKYSF